MKIHGIIPALITPFTEGGALDPEGLVQLVEHLVTAGVHGIFAAGTTGESWALTHEERKELYRATVECVAGRVPVYVGTGVNDTQETVELSRYAASTGADFLSIITPSFVHPDDEELYRHYTAIAGAVDAPIILYTNPGRTGVHLSTGVVARLARDCNNIVAIKDSSADLKQTIDYVRACPEGFEVIAGHDSLILGTLVHGGVAAMAAAANVVPELPLELYRCFQAGDYRRAAELQLKVAALREVLFLGSFPAGVKEAVAWSGLPAGPVRPPLGCLREDDKRRLVAVLERLAPVEGRGGAAG